MSEPETEKPSLAERVNDAMMKALFRPDELVLGSGTGAPPEDAVIVDGVVQKFAFHKERLEALKPVIAELIAELPTKFNKGGRRVLGNDVTGALSGGGGWSFLQMYLDKNGNHWGEHQNCEALLVLAIGTGLGGYVLPRDIWQTLPGGMPYVWLG